MGNTKKEIKIIDNFCTQRISVNILCCMFPVSLYFLYAFVFPQTLTSTQLCLLCNTCQVERPVFELVPLPTSDPRVGVRAAQESGPQSAGFIVAMTHARWGLGCEDPLAGSSWLGPAHCRRSSGETGAPVLKPDGQGCCCSLAVDLE